MIFWRYTTLGIAVILGISAMGSRADEARGIHLDRKFFEQCAFVCVDFQEGQPPAKPMTQDQVPALWKTMGFTADDVNAANDFLWQNALPNAVKVTECCRRMGLPMIFIHWGCQFEDGMDLDPDVRAMLLKEHGEDYSKWGHHCGDLTSCPAKALGVRKGEYVLAKTAQDAFKSCSLGFVLRNLGVKRIVFIGGHTEACLGKTSKSAKELGYETLCVEDATFNARESTRRKGIEDSGYTYVVTTDAFLAAAGAGR